MQNETRYVIRGSLRKKILLGLEQPNTPTELAKELGTDRPSVSRSILFLCKKGILKCINPKDKRGRLYIITSKGRRVRRDLRRRNQIEGL